MIPSGRLVLKQDFTSPKPGISDLSPVKRVEITLGKRIIRNEPVYFKINTLYEFEKIRINFKTEKLPSLPIQVGLRTQDRWNYVWQKYEGQTLEFNWHPYFDNRNIEAVISIPGILEKGDALVLDEINVELLRQPLNIKRFKRYVKKIYLNN